MLNSTNGPVIKGEHKAGEQHAYIGMYLMVVLAVDEFEIRHESADRRVDKHHGKTPPILGQ